MNLQDFNSDSIIESLIDGVEKASKRRIETLYKEAITGIAALISLSDRMNKIKTKPKPTLVNGGLTLGSYKTQIVMWLGRNMTEQEIKMELQKLNFQKSCSSISNFIKILRTNKPDVPLTATLSDAIILLKNYGTKPEQITEQLNELGFKTNRGTPIKTGTIHFFYLNNNFEKKDYRYQHTRYIDVDPKFVKKE